MSKEYCCGVLRRLVHCRYVLEQNNCLVAHLTDGDKSYGGIVMEYCMHCGKKL